MAQRWSRLIVPLFFAVSASSQIPTSYSFVLYDVPGSTTTQINSVNDRGDVAGTYTTPDMVVHGFVRFGDSSGVITFGAPTGNGPQTPVINSHGQVAFSSGASTYGGFFTSTTSVLYLRSADGQQIAALKELGGSGIVTGINDQGQVIGYVITPGIDLPFIVNPDGSVPAIKLSRLRNNGINNAGQVLWIANYPFPSVAATLFLVNRDGTASGKRLDLPSYVGQAAMSDNGLVAGTLEQANLGRGFVGDLGSDAYTFLDVPGYEGRTQVNGVNDFGVVVGTAGNYPSQHGFIGIPASTVPQLFSGGVTNAASYANAAVSPGEVVTLFGTGLGPPALTLAIANNSGSVDRTLLSTRVWFDGVSAPLLYVRGDQVAAVVPYEVTGPVTQIQVEYQGNRCSPVAVPVTSSVPGIFTVDGSGLGPGVVLNQDGSFNTAINPIQRGDIIVLYATGLGQTLPAGITGTITGTNLPIILRQPLPITVLIGNTKAQIVYDGPAPATVAGVSQINVIVPADAPHGTTVPLIVEAGTAVSRSGVTVAIK